MVLFVLARFFEAVVWYETGLFATQLVDPVTLSFNKLKTILECRGLGYSGLAEKRDVRELVEKSGKAFHDKPMLSKHLQIQWSDLLWLVLNSVQINQYWWWQNCLTVSVHLSFWKLLESGSKLSHSIVSWFTHTPHLSWSASTRVSWSASTRVSWSASTPHISRSATVLLT